MLTTTLEDNWWPVTARHFPQKDYIFQDNNVHRARSVMEYRLRNKIKTLKWPAQSPDLNTIENVWYRLKQELQQEAESIHTIDNLHPAIRRIWETCLLNTFTAFTSRFLEELRSV